MNKNVFLGGVLLIIVTVFFGGCNCNCHSDGITVLPERPIKKVNLGLVLNKDLKNQISALDIQQIKNLEDFIHNNTQEDINKTIRDLKEAINSQETTSVNTTTSSAPINQMKYFITDPSVLDDDDCRHGSLCYLIITLGEGCAHGGCDGDLFKWLFVDPYVLLDNNIQFVNSIDKKVTEAFLINNNTGVSITLSKGSNNTYGLAERSSTLLELEQNHSIELLFREKLPARGK